MPEQSPLERAGFSLPFDLHGGFRLPYDGFCAPVTTNFADGRGVRSVTRSVRDFALSGAQPALCDVQTALSGCVVCAFGVRCLHFPTVAVHLRERAGMLTAITPAIMPAATVVTKSTTLKPALLKPSAAAKTKMQSSM